MCCRLSTAGVLLLVFANVQPVPVLPYEHSIKSSVLKDHALRKGSELFDQSAKKGVSEEEAVNGFAEDNGKKYEKSHDQGRYDHEDAAKKAHENKGGFLDENFHKVQGGSLADVGKKQSHKKGHHKSGYHNSYHKDETGGNSSFYDDANDEGDEAYYNSRKGNYGDVAHKQEQGSHMDGQLYSNGQGKHGGYNTGNDYGQQHGDSRKYNQGRYYDDRRQQGVSNHGNQYGEHGVAQEQEYKHHNPSYAGYNNYHQPYPVVAPPVQAAVTHHVARPIVYPQQPKITVYEDPRVPYSQGGYYDDRIDYRPSPYYGKQPLYNNNYYQY